MNKKHKKQKQYDGNALLGFILTGIIIPVISLYKHLTCCPYCAESGLNPFCLAKCCWSLPIAVIFFILLYESMPPKK